MTKRIIISLAASALILSSGFVSTAAMAQTEGAPVVDESGANSGSTATPAKKGKAHKKSAHKKSAAKKGHKKHKKSAAAPTS